MHHHGLFTPCPDQVVFLMVVGLMKVSKGSTSCVTAFRKTEHVIRMDRLRNSCWRSFKNLRPMWRLSRRVRPHLTKTHSMLQRSPIKFCIYWLVTLDIVSLFSSYIYILLAYSRLLVPIESIIVEYMAIVLLLWIGYLFLHHGFKLHYYIAVTQLYCTGSSGFRESNTLLFRGSCTASVYARQHCLSQILIHQGSLPCQWHCTNTVFYQYKPCRYQSFWAKSQVHWRTNIGSDNRIKYMEVFQSHQVNDGTDPDTYEYGMQKASMVELYTCYDTG